MKLRMSAVFSVLSALVSQGALAITYYNFSVALPEGQSFSLDKISKVDLRLSCISLQSRHMHYTHHKDFSSSTINADNKVFIPTAYCNGGGHNATLHAVEVKVWRIDEGVEKVYKCGKHNFHSKIKLTPVVDEKQNKQFSCSWEGQKS